MKAVKILGRYQTFWYRNKQTGNLFLNESFYVWDAAKILYLAIPSAQFFKMLICIVIAYEFDVSSNASTIDAFDSRRSKCPP